TWRNFRRQFRERRIRLRWLDLRNRLGRALLLRLRQRAKLRRGEQIRPRRRIDVEKEYVLGRPPKTTKATSATAWLVATRGAPVLPHGADVHGENRHDYEEHNREVEDCGK